MGKKQLTLSKLCVTELESFSSSSESDTSNRCKCVNWTLPLHWCMFLIWVYPMILFKLSAYSLSFTSSTSFFSLVTTTSGYPKSRTHNLKLATIGVKLKSLHTHTQNMQRFAMATCLQGCLVIFREPFVLADLQSCIFVSSSWSFGRKVLVGDDLQPPPVP